LKRPCLKKQCGITPLGSGETGDFARISRFAPDLQGFLLY